MPDAPKNKGGGKTSKKKDKGGSWFKNQLSDLKNVAAGAPGAVYQSLTALDQALPASPIKSLEKSAFERKGRHNDPTALKEQGRMQLEGLRALGNPKAWKEETALNLLTALGAAATVTGVGGALGTGLNVASKGARLAPRKPPTRTLSAKPKNEKQAKKWAEARGLDPGQVGKNTKFKVEVPAAKPATTRATQKGVDKVRSAVPAWQRRKVGAQIRQEQDILSRLNEPTQGGFVNAIKTLRKGDFSRDKNFRQLVREINSGARGSILFRPGYIGPNLLGALGSQAIHGSLSPQAFATRAHLNKNMKPETLARQRNMHGSGISQAALDVGLEGRRAGDANPQGPVATLMSGIGESLAKVTDRPSRDVIFQKEAARQGYKTPEDFDRLLDPETVFSDPVLRRDLLQIVKRTEPAAIKFSRTSGGNKFDRFLAENVFLYKWLTGSARYTGHVAGQHPTLTAALANAPRGEDVTDLLGEATPEFMKSFIPFGEGSKYPQVLNTQSLSLWETLPEAAETLKAMWEKDPEQAIRMLAPVQKAGALAATGYHTISGKRLSDYDFSEDKQRLSEGGGASQIQKLLWALNETANMSPYTKLHPRFRSGLHPSSLKEEAIRVFTPMGGLYRRNVDPKVAAFIAAAETEEKSGKKKVKKRRF